MAASPNRPNTLFTLTDKALKPNKVLTVDTSSSPARIVSEIVLKKKTGSPNYDLEGISVAAEGGFWLVSEGKTNALIQVDQEGLVIDEIGLPKEVEDQIDSHGLEGVAEQGDHVYVAFQSGWSDDAEPLGHIGRYTPLSGEWRFATYRRPDSHFASGLTNGPGGAIHLLLRDKLSREKARAKEIVKLSVNDFESGRLPIMDRIDLVEVYQQQKIPVPEKLEGLAFDGTSFWVVNDNDAMNDSYGETHLIRIEGND